MESERSFQLIILNEDWFDLSLGYDPDPAQEKLVLADTSDSLLTISPDQIEQYDWDLQTISLTDQATTDLINKLADQELTLSAELKQLHGLKATMGRENPIERALYLHAFVVQVDQQTKYGGVFLNFISQMAINFPVIRVTLVDGKAVFAILPIHMPYSTSETALKFNTKIQDQNIFQIFDDAGLLKK